MPPSRIQPGPGQESVWDYPRPPRLEAVAERLTVSFGGVFIADTVNGYRVLETSHPPVYYIPPGDIRMEAFRASSRRSFCEFKGEASYVSLEAGGRRAPDAGWLYARPTPDFSPIAGNIAFYASRVDACTVGGETVSAQEGTFYGGWVTSRIVGPFKGPPGTMGW